MGVPETAMNEDGYPASAHDDVWRTRQIAAMQPEAHACGKQHSPYQHFGHRILAPDA